MIALGAGLRHALIAVGVGAVAGVVALLLLDPFRASRSSEGLDDLLSAPRDRVVEAAAELRVDGVYVAPDGRGLIDEEGERRVEEAVAAAEVPVYVMVWADAQDNGVWSPDLTDTLALEIGLERGTLLVWQGPQVGEEETFGGGSYSSVSTFDFVGDPGVTLPQIVEGVGSADDWYPDDDSDYWGGAVGGMFAGLLFAAGVMLALSVPNGVLRLVLGRWPLPGTWRWRTPSPASRRRGRRG